MTLKKAIEILNDITHLFDPDEDVDIYDALQLGIEALKRVIFHRSSSLADPHILLPGETKGV